MGIPDPPETPPRGGAAYGLDETRHTMVDVGDMAARAVKYSKRVDQRVVELTAEVKEIAKMAREDRGVLRGIAPKIDLVLRPHAPPPPVERYARSYAPAAIFLVLFAWFVMSTSRCSSAPAEPPSASAHR